MKRALAIWSVLAATAIAVFAVALGAGSTSIGMAEVGRALFSTESSTASDIVMKLRLPRALAAFATGGLLAVAGALMQVLLRNPLADPYVLGLSGGAAVGALGALLLGVSLAAMNASAALGALAATALVFALARRDFARQQLFGAVDASPRLLLTGVVVAAGFSAIIIMMLTLAPETKLRGMLFWLMGDLNGAESWLPAMVTLLLCVAFAYPVARDLNVMLRGESLAHALGVRVAVLRRGVYAVASVATAFAVTTAGTIGFVGLVVPHALRLAIGNDQRVLLPACAIAGGAFLLAADTLARTLTAPLQLPVGVVTAMFGVPAFMFLLTRKPRSA